MNRIVLLIAAIILLPTLAFGGYFAWRLLASRGATSRGQGGLVASDPDRVVVPPRPFDPPEPTGPILRPDPLEGEVVETLISRGKDARYRIQPGDTLSTIAKQIYGDGTYVQDILVANPTIHNENQIRAGQEIVLPRRRGEGGATSDERLPICVVRPGETLIDIARRQYGDAAMHVEIFNLNRDRLSSVEAPLRAGLRLRLPPAQKY